MKKPRKHRTHKKKARARAGAKRPYPAHLRQFWFKKKSAGGSGSTHTKKARTARRSRRAHSTPNEGVEHMRKTRGRKRGGSRKRGRRSSHSKGAGGRFTLASLKRPTALALVAGGAVAGAYAAWNYWPKLPGANWKGENWAPLAGAAAVGIGGALVASRFNSAAGWAVLAGAIGAGYIAYKARAGTVAAGGSAGGLLPASFTTAPALPVASTGGQTTADRIGSVIGQIFSRIPTTGIAGFNGGQRAVEY